MKFRIRTTIDSYLNATKYSSEYIEKLKLFKIETEEKPDGWNVTRIEVDNLEDLLVLVSKCGHDIILSENKQDGCFELEIYDDYREQMKLQLCLWALYTLLAILFTALAVRKSKKDNK